MPRVSDERIHNGLDKYDSGEFVNWNGYFVVDVLRDLQDARKEIQALRAQLAQEQESSKRAIEGIIESNEKLFNRGIF